jgi:protein-tyrosine-phosphatase
VDLSRRVELFAALADPHRLAMVDALALGDLTARDVAAAAAIPMNLASHHLAVLEAVGLVQRRVSEGDHRRRYVILRREVLGDLIPVVTPSTPVGPILFVCTRNSARSQFAAGLWRLRTGGAATSAGSQPSTKVHPEAVRAAARRGVDLRDAVPRGYDEVRSEPACVVSVCDRAREAGVPFAAPLLHWSVPDPLEAGGARAFTSAFAEISDRIELLAACGAAG